MSYHKFWVLRFALSMFALFFFSFFFNLVTVKKIVFKEHNVTRIYTCPVT